MIAGRPSLNAPIVCLCRLSATVVPMTGVVVSWKEKPTGFPFPSRNWKTLVRSPSFVGICQLARPSKEREKKNKSVGEECDSTLLVPLASSRTMHFLHPLPPSPKKTFSTASYTCFFFPFYICCCGLIIIPRPSIKNDDNSVVTSVVDVCWCLSGCAAIDWLKGNKKKGVGSPIGFLRQTEEKKIKRLFLLLLLSNRPCQSVRGRELIESV